MVRTHSRSLVRLAAARALRAELLDMAAQAAKDRGSAHVLWLIEPRMTEGRVAEEWEELRGFLRPQVMERLALALLTADGRVVSFGDPSPGPPPDVSARGGERRRGRAPLPPVDFGFVIQKLLTYAWAEGRGPVTTRWLARTAGCSYPTAMAAVRRLEPPLVRGSDRRVELERFPREEWGRLLATAEAARSTMRFADRSGQPRPLESLVRRAQELRVPGIALGGVLAARHYQPEIDLVGLPRLDLSVHSPGRWPDLGFVRRLDPALECTTDRHEAARLVLHFVRHEESLFREGDEGLPRVDPIECLLDLHEARLEPQAADFVRALAARRGEALGAR